MNMTIEDIKEFKRNAVEILERNTQYATARAVEQAFNALVVLRQYKWERDTAITQLEKLGVGFGEKIDSVYLSNEKTYEPVECEVSNYELNPCGFCGGKPYENMAGIFCEDCGMGVSRYGKTNKQVVEAWNNWKNVETY